MVFRIKEFCHLESKVPAQMPFESLRYLIFIARNEGKSEMVCLFVRL